MRHNRWIMVLMIAALVVPIACEHAHKEQIFRASVVVMRNGLYEPGALVTFFADKLEAGGSPVGGDQMTADKFTDFVGYADYLFGYNLDYDEDLEQFDQGVRVVAAVTEGGLLYSDTVWTPVSFKPVGGEYQLAAMNINLPVK